MTRTPAPNPSNVNSTKKMGRVPLSLPAPERVWQRRDAPQIPAIWKDQAFRSSLLQSPFESLRTIERKLGREAATVNGLVE